MSTQSSSENIDHSHWLGTSGSEISVGVPGPGSIHLNPNYRPQPNNQHEFHLLKPSVLELPSPSIEVYDHKRTKQNIRPRNPRQMSRYNSSTHSFKTLYFPNTKEGPNYRSTRNQAQNYQSKRSEKRISNSNDFEPPVVEVYRKAKSRNKSLNVVDSIDENRNLRSNLPKNPCGRVPRYQKSPVQKSTYDRFKTRMKEPENYRLIQSTRNKSIGIGKRKLLGSTISREEFHFVNRIKYVPQNQNGAGMNENEREEKPCNLICKRKASPRMLPTVQVEKSETNYKALRETDEMGSPKMVVTTLRSFGTNPGKGYLPNPNTGIENVHFRGRSRESRHRDRIHEVQPSTDLFIRYSDSIEEPTESLAKCSIYTTEGKYKVHPRKMKSRYMQDLEWRIGHAVNIYVYRNGVENESPTLVHIPPNQRRNMVTLIETLQERIKYPVGYANALYTMDGALVKHPFELEMYNNYVIASNFDKHFKCVQYGRKRTPLLVFSKESKNARALKFKKKDSSRVKRKANYEAEDPHYFYNYEGNQSEFDRDRLNYYEKLREFNIPPPELSYVNTIRDFDGIEHSGTTIYKSSSKKNPYLPMAIRRGRPQEFHSNLNQKNNNFLPSSLSPNEVPIIYKMDNYRNYIGENIIPPPTAFRD